MEQGIMAWAMKKDADKRAKENASLALEKRRQDMDVWKEKLGYQLEKEKLAADYRDTLADENTAASNEREDANKLQKAVSDRIAARREDAAVKADNAKIGSTKPIAGRNNSELVYKGKGQWIVKDKEGTGEPKDELIRFQKYREKLNPKDPNYKQKRDEINGKISKITSSDPNLTVPGLTKAALGGDEDAKILLDKINQDKVTQARLMGKAGAEGKMEGLEGAMDLDGVARSIIAGKEQLDNVRNVFGVAIQELARKKVLEVDPDFNFNKPRATVKGVTGSILQQTKQRGAAGSFIKNIDAQVNRVDEIMQDLVKRVGVRALDIPRRALVKNVIGSGHENVIEAYLTEISNEIGKLSTNSQASVRELSVEAQEKWGKIHDVNLSFRELRKILTETKHMGALRLESIDDELEETLNLLDNINEPTRPTAGSKPRFEIIE